MSFGKPALPQSSRAVWGRGGLKSGELLKQLVRRSRTHKLADRAALLSFYFLLALFPLLIALSTLIGFILSSETSTYFSLLNYLDRIMPRSAFAVLDELLGQLAAGASGGKLSFGVIASLWTASSGVTALIEALNVAFEVSNTRSWWQRRTLALGLTLGIGLLCASALALLFAGTTVARVLTARLPFLGSLGEVSGVIRWFVGLVLIFISLTVIYGVGPHLNRKRWEGILPGTVFALTNWLIASLALRFYLLEFTPLVQSYGSLAGVIALLFWLYLTGASIILGGELNAIIWNATQPGS